MLALLPNYLPLEVIVGMGVGLLGGLLVMFVAPLPFRRYPASFADVAAIALFLIILLLPIVFPLTLFLAFTLTFLSVWMVPPILFSANTKPAKPKGRLPAAPEPSSKYEDIHEAVEALSPEGRAALLEDMRIFQ